MEYEIQAPKVPKSFISEKEGFLIKSSGIGIFEKWKKHWCILRDGFFWYYDCDEAIPKLDEAERVVSLERASVTVLNQKNFELHVPGYSRKFRCSSNEELNSWVQSISSHSGLVTSNHHDHLNCFAPIRSGINAKWYVDGKDAMEAILQAMLKVSSFYFQI